MNSEQKTALRKRRNARKCVILLCVNRGLSLEPQCHCKGTEVPQDDNPDSVLRLQQYNIDHSVETRMKLLRCHNT